MAADALLLSKRTHVTTNAVLCDKVYDLLNHA